MININAIKTKMYMDHRVDITKLPIQSWKFFWQSLFIRILSAQLWRLKAQLPKGNTSPHRQEFCIQTVPTFTKWYMGGQRSYLITQSVKANNGATKIPYPGTVTSLTPKAPEIRLVKFANSWYTQTNAKCSKKCIQARSFSTVCGWH